MRQIVLDTETTGLDPLSGHRIIEIGCVELINRRVTENHYHQYIQPNQEIDAGAIEVHGITNEFIADKPLFSEIVDDFLGYINGAELIIHNAPFDVGFINHELSLAGNYQPIDVTNTVTDTLVMARRIYTGAKNSLDALCRRLDIDNTHRVLHGALLDSEILAEVYLSLTGGQESLMFGSDDEIDGVEPIRRFPKDRKPLRIIRPNNEELAAHNAYLEKIGQNA